MSTSQDTTQDPTQDPTDRFPLVAVQIALFLLGAVLGVWGAFLVPLRLPGGTEGLAVLIAFAGNFGIGLAASRATGSVPAAAMPGIGWFVSVMVLSAIARPSDEVVIPSSLAVDPGVGKVGTLFLVAGLLGTVLAAVVANRQARATPGPPADRHL